MKRLVNIKGSAKKKKKKEAIRYLSPRIEEID